MAKKTAARKSAGGTNRPGTTDQPSAADQAEGVALSSADPAPALKRDHGARLDSLEKKIDQLCIKVGI